MPHHKGKCDKSRRCDKGCSFECSEQSCCPRDCSFKDECCKDSRKVCCEYKDAVVDVTCEYVLLGAGITDAAAPTTPIGVNTRADIVLKGTGFLVKFPRKEKKCKKGKKKSCKKCKCTYSNCNVCGYNKSCGKCNKCYNCTSERGPYVVFTADRALLPPTWTSSLRLYENGDEDSITAGRMLNQMQNATRILVTVHNVNNEGCDHTYTAILRMVSGVGNVAIAEICMEDSHNKCHPHIRHCHPKLMVCSKGGCNVKCGDKAYILGDFSGYSKNTIGTAAGPNISISEGVVADANFIDKTGWMAPPSILVNECVYSDNVGLPILNCRGDLIAMQTTNVIGALPANSGDDTLVSGVADGHVTGVKAEFICKLFKEYFKGPCRNTACPRIESVGDGASCFYRYVHPYLGVAWRVPCNGALNTVRDYTSGSPTGDQPQFVFDGSDLCKNGYLSVDGIQVIGVAGLNPEDITGVAGGYYYVPGNPEGSPATAPLFENMPVSPLLGEINPGDILVSATVCGHGGASKRRTYALGSGKCQKSLAELLWCLRPSEQITLTYAQANTDGTCEDGCCVETECKPFCLENAMPLGLDYPWYNLSDVQRVLYPAPVDPLIYPQFTSPATQLAYVPYPQLNTTNAGIFRPPL